MKTIFLAISILAGGHVFSQVHVFKSTDNKVVKVFVHKKSEGHAKAELPDNKEWDLLFNSELKGWFSVFAAGKIGDEKKFFYSLGEQSSKDAISKARKQAQDYCFGKNGCEFYIIGTVLNENRYPLN